MFTFIDLPDPSGLEVNGIIPTRRRGFGISPDSQRICGTYVDPQDNVARWWTGVPTTPGDMYLWNYQRGLVGTEGGSARTTNDAGDIAGFRGGAALTQPMFGPGGGAAAAGFAFDAMDTTQNGAVYGIDNEQNMVGAFCLRRNNPLYPNHPVGKPIGFKAKADSPTAATNPLLILDTWSDNNPNGIELRGINSQGDLVGGTSNGQGFVLLDPGSASEKPVDVGAFPWLAALQPTAVVISGINSQRIFVGWFNDAVGVQHGIWGFINDLGEVGGLLPIDHPGPAPAGTMPMSGTQVFGISEAGFMIGTYNNNIPFLSVKYPDPPPPDSGEWWNEALNAAARAMVRKVSAAVAGGAGGLVVPPSGRPIIVDPPLPWLRPIERLLDAYRSVARIEDEAARKRAAAPLLDSLRAEIDKLAKSSHE